MQPHRPEQSAAAPQIASNIDLGAVGAASGSAAGMAEDTPALAIAVARECLVVRRKPGRAEFDNVPLN